MKPMLAWLALLAVVVLGPALAMAQSMSDTSGPTMNVKGIIAKQQSIACTSADPSSCRTQLVVTAGPTKGSEKPGHPPATIMPVTVVIMPHTPITWTRVHRTVDPNQLHTGDAVDIDYQLVGGENVATRVDVSLQ
ncbi:MAG TPA: hypothetical protein VKZ50_10970 [bacterium]|nr:hypothetical protein [bacterium]